MKCLNFPDAWIYMYIWIVLDTFYLQKDCKKKRKVSWSVVIARNIFLGAILSLSLSREKERKSWNNSFPRFERRGTVIKESEISKFNWKVSLSEIIRRVEWWNEWASVNIILARRRINGKHAVYMQIAIVKCTIGLWRDWRERWKDSEGDDAFVASTLTIFPLSLPFQHNPPSLLSPSYTPSSSILKIAYKRDERMLRNRGNK